MNRELGAIQGRLRNLTRPLISVIRGIPAEAQEAPGVHEVPFVGRVDEKEMLTKFLVSGFRDDVMAVLGDEVRTGKTALVREVTTDSEVSGYFDVKIWVNVSPPFDVNRIMKEIIAGVREGDEDEEEVLGEEQSLHLLARLLDDSKRYLFVLDNIFVPVSDSERWLSFWSLLVGGGAAGSKILATVSNSIFGPSSIFLRGKDREDAFELPRETASQGRQGRSNMIHNTQKLQPTSYSTYGISSIFLRGMDREDTHVLLRETASQGREGDHIFHDPEILNIARDIVDECGRDPRTIKTVGGYLSLQPLAAEDWSRFLVRLGDSADSAMPLLLHGGYPYSDLTSPGVKSYNNLPHRIKRCFTLCSLFPRGHPINPHTLAELWISLGFINNNHEDIAYGYLDALLREELLRVKEVDIFGNVKSVALHPNAQGLAHSVAGWECLAIDIYNLRMEYYPVQDARHQSVISYQGNLWYGFQQRKLRTFLHFEEDPTKLEDMYRDLIPKLIPGLIPGLIRMRVLDLHNVMAGMLPEGVWKLKHLRYLDLSGNSTLEMLPPTITRLLNLQTLKLSRCSSLTELPCDMNNLSALRHLYIDGCWKLSFIPRGLGNLKFLNVLTDFILPPDDSSKKVDSADFTDLCKLNDLRGSLKITYLGCYEDELIDQGLEGLLDKKSYLESVELRFMNLPTDTSLLEKLLPHPNLKRLRIHNYGGSQLPDWMTRLSSHLPNLIEIVLIGFENCMYLPQFGHLPQLKKLTIQGLPDLEHMESGSGQSPPEDADGAPPLGKLSSLCFKDCPKLNFLPITPRLMKLTLVNVSEDLFRHPCQLPNLKTLHLENIEFLDHLPEKWLRDLKNVMELHIRSCPSLVSLSSGIHHLEKLKTLSIWNCKALDLSKDDQGNIMTELRGLKSLQCLTIYKALKMEHLPEWLSHVATLRSLCIRSCPSLVVLPKWIGSLQSLKLLELIHCPMLASLPEGIHHSPADTRRNSQLLDAQSWRVGRKGWN